MTGTELRVLTADDHRLFREGVRALLRSIEGVRVVAEAADGEEAVELALEHVPDVVLMDLDMPGRNGLDASRRILAGRPGIGGGVVTMFEDPDLVFAALRAGARGHVLKGAAQDELMRAIRTVSEGHAIYIHDARIAARMLSFSRASRRDLPLGASGSPRRRCATTCRRCCRGCRWRTGRRPRSRRARPASAKRRARTGRARTARATLEAITVRTSLTTGRVEA